MSINNFNHIKKMEKLLKFQNKLSPSIPITSMATELARTQELFAAGTGIVDKLNTYSLNKSTRVFCSRNRDSR